MKIQEIIGKRIAESRKKRGLTLKGLAESSNGTLTSSCVANWEAGTRTPGPNEAILLGELLHVMPSYLLGLSNDEAGNIFIKEPEFASAPLLTIEQAADPFNSIQMLRKEQADHIKYAPLGITEKRNEQKNYFAIQIQDDSMSPTIGTGDIVILDPDQKPKPGGLVAAKMTNQSGVIIRQYKQHGFNDAFESFELIAFNDNWANVTIERPDIAYIVGVVCQSMHFYL